MRSQELNGTHDAFYEVMLEPDLWPMICSIIDGNGSVFIASCARSCKRAPMRMRRALQAPGDPPDLAQVGDAGDRADSIAGRPDGQLGRDSMP
ncbi:hypothetical protein M3U22_13225 [Xanthomonas sp. PPL121]